MFEQFALNVDDPYTRLYDSCIFENTARGRQGAVLVARAAATKPLVRTTTPYILPNQDFQAIHHEICQQIYAHIDAQFNNALIEHYMPECRRMKYHTDQALDLAVDSYICIYSCYSNQTAIERTQSSQTAFVRFLEIINKTTLEASSIPLLHNTVVAFTSGTNSKYRHRIIARGPTNPWLGLTLRQSKTHLVWRDGWRFDKNGRELRMATDEERRNFFIMKRRENEETDFVYPELDYTISPSDLYSSRSTIAAPYSPHRSCSSMSQGIP